LYDLAKRYGGIRALAEELGVCEATMGAWVNLRHMPKLHGHGAKPAMKKVVLELCRMTGKRPEDLFPGFVREQLHKIPRQIEVKRDFAMLQLSDATNDRLTLPSPADVAADADTRAVLREKFEELFRTLTYREREIIKLRYGFADDGVSYNLAETAHIFKVTRERIRQIENKAIRKLQQPCRAGKLVEFIE
jgi:RNA polymerase sigma factor (sigma-70 family)